MINRTNNLDRQIPKLSLIVISSLVILITYLFIQLQHHNMHDHKAVFEQLLRIKNVNNDLHREVLLVKTGIVRHYNRLDDNFNKIYNTLSKLEEEIQQHDSSHSQVILQQLHGMREKLAIKEAATNTLKSDIGVLRNSLMYLSQLNEQIITVITDNQYSDTSPLIENVNNELISVSSKIINMLRNPHLLSESEFNTNKNNLEILNWEIHSPDVAKKLDLYMQHLEIIWERSHEIEQAMLLINSSDITKQLDKIQTSDLTFQQQVSNEKSNYQALIYILSLVLVFYATRLLWLQISSATKNRALARHLSYQKNALDVHAIVSVTDNDGIITEVNSNYCRVFEIDRQHVIGTPLLYLKQEEENRSFYHDLWETIEGGDIWHSEIEERSYKGNSIWLDLTIVPFQNSQGKVYQYVSIATDITGRKAAENKIEFQAYHDPLTGLPNRNLLNDRLDNAIHLCNHHHHLGGILLIDLDRFKTINDSLGHGIGDQLLIEVAERLQKSVDKEDCVARIGGDEFVILIPEAGDDELSVTLALQSKAEKICNIINKSFTIKDHQLYLSTSIGVSTFPNLADTSSEVLQQADTALYKAKDAGRSSYKFYDNVMQRSAEQRLLLESDLRAALKHNEFQIHLQPQYNAQHDMIGAEVLLRWNHHSKGLISPADFIPVAEETGFIIPIGEWVLKETFNKVKQWCDLSPEYAHCDRIAINVSPAQFMHDDFTNTVQRLIEQSGVNPHKIELEITEGMLINNIDSTIRKINQLKEFGISFSIDDFGTGYSSLSYLNKLPISKLKIDQAFVRDIHNNSSNQTIVETIIYMAKKLGISIIAEGVENQAELNCLQQLGCTNFQGYYFNRPLPLVQFEALVSEIMMPNTCQTKRN